MSYKVLFILSAIVAVVFGLGFLIVPGQVLPLFGTTEQYVSTIFATRFLGFAFFAFGLVLWFAKDVTEAKAQNGLGIAMLIVSAVGFVLSIVGTMESSKVIRANSWVPIALFALSGLGYAFMVFIKPKMKE